MTAKPDERIDVTRDDVLNALEKYPDTLRTVADVARLVVTRVYNIEHVYDGQTAMWHVHQANLKRLLAGMVADGSLVKRTGEGWEEHGAPGWLGRPNGHYYVLPSQARAWQEAADQGRAKALQEEAEEHARRVLAEQYPEEFASLVHAYREENGAAVAEGAGQ
jgi:hypothetical protein